MANGTWKRTTKASRRAERQIRYAHVSVAVGEDSVGRVVRTPKGQGSTATRLTPKVKARKRHDWAGEYLGRLASVEVAARERRKMNQLKRLPLERLLISTEGSESVGCTGIPIDFLNTEEDLT